MVRPVFLLFAAALLLPAAVLADKKSSSSTFPKPYKETKEYTVYKFTTYQVQTVTSYRPAPLGNPADPNEPGSQATLTSEIFTKQGGPLVGIGSWARDVVSLTDIPDSGGDKEGRRLLTAIFEFGREEDGYDDVLSTTVLTKWLLSDGPAQFSDYEGVIAGGRGKFASASGGFSVDNVVIVNGLLSSATFRWLVYVPKLPKY